VAWGPSREEFEDALCREHRWPWCFTSSRQCESLELMTVLWDHLLHPATGGETEVHDRACGPSGQCVTMNSGFCNGIRAEVMPMGVVLGISSSGCGMGSGALPVLCTNFNACYYQLHSQKRKPWKLLWRILAESEPSGHNWETVGSSKFGISLSPGMAAGAPKSCSV
jgi:hypothetical protein